MPTLRSYQSEDAAAVIKAHETHQCVLGRAATGLGKAVVAAFLAKHYSQFGRVMVLVDVSKLVMQLAHTIQWVTGFPPGIEMGENRAFNEPSLTTSHDQIIVSTVQTQYSGKEGSERYRQFDPKEFSLIILDECETFLATRAREVVEWYRQNPNTKIFGCSATPIRTDGVAMGELFQTVAIDRDIHWGIQNGWLVSAKQAFVKVDIDFSSLKLAKDKDGEKDYRDSELARLLLESEEKLVGLAKGIIQLAEGRKSIVVCPDVASAKAITHYLDAEQSGCARVIYGELSDAQKESLFNGHDNGEFPTLVSVMMLTKGWDSPDTKMVFVCRKTQSKRLYQQIVGRVVRPLKGILEDLDGPDPAPRRAAIAASNKDHAVVVNMVGIDENVRDMTILDILGEVDDEDVMDRARRKLMEGKTVDEAMAEAKRESEQDQVANRCAAEIAKDVIEADERELMKQRRLSRDVKATVHAEWTDGLSAPAMSGAGEQFIPERQLNILTKAKVPQSTIAKLTPPEAAHLSQRIVARWRLGLCTYKQERLLWCAGYDRMETEKMSIKSASEAIDELAKNNWKRKVMA